MSNFLNILKYFSVLTALLDLLRLIRQAEDTFGPGTGPQKLEEVTSKWGALVSALQITGLLNAKLSSAFIGGAPIIIGVVVQVLNTFGVFKEKSDQPQPEPKPEPAPSGPKYATPFDGEYPGDEEAKARGYNVGDYVHIGEGGRAQWAVQPKNLLRLDGFRQDHRIK